MNTSIRGAVVEQYFEITSDGGNALLHVLQLAFLKYGKCVGFTRQDAVLSLYWHLDTGVHENIVPLGPEEMYPLVLCWLNSVPKQQRKRPNDIPGGEGSYGGGFTAICNHNSGYVLLEIHAVTLYYGK